MLLRTKIRVSNNRTGIRITREVPSPLHKRAVLELSARYGVAPDCAQRGGVCQLGLGCDDAEGDVVVDGLKECVSARRRFDRPHLSLFDIHSRCVPPA